MAFAAVLLKVPSGLQDQRVPLPRVQAPLAHRPPEAEGPGGGIVTATTPRRRQDRAEGQKSSLGASGSPESTDDVLAAVRASQRPQRSKYGNRRVSLDGYTFDSKAEGDRYVVLRERLRLGEIMDLAVHPGYRLEVAGQLICHYIADFAYHDPETYAETVEDVKGVRTAAYMLKRKLMKAIHGIDVQEIKAR